MSMVHSNDGTAIAFDRSGDGSPVMLVGGAFQHRAFDPRMAQLSALLAKRFTVFSYDRRDLGTVVIPAVRGRARGRGSASTRHRGRGSASVFGESSGGNLAQEAAPCGLTITRLAVWEPNFRVDGSRALLPHECVRQLTEFEQGGWTDPLMGEHGRYLSDRQRKSPPSMNRFKEAR